VSHVQFVVLSSVAQINPAVGVLDLNGDDLVDFVPMAAIDADHSESVAQDFRPYEAVKRGYTGFKNGDVLLAKITPCFENGKISQVRTNTGIGFGSTEFHVIRADATALDPRYLVRFLRQDKIRIEGERRMTGSGGQRRVPKSFLEALQIFLPTLEEQRRIAAILDQADALRALRREALVQLDSLTQAIFIEMFGDPISNPQRLPTTLFAQLCTRITDGTHQAPTWESEGIPFLFISNIVDGEITYQTNKFISEETYHELTRRCAIEMGDVLYTTVGSYGNSAVVNSKRKFAFQRHIAHIKPEASKLNSLFCAAMLQSPGVRRQVDKIARGVAQKTVNLADLKRLLVFAPSLADQQSFATRIQAVEALKATHRTALAELDALFASLQHRAFSGAL
jgi:type I restriction enzyme S subunit